MAFVEKKVSKESILQMVEESAIIASSSFGLVLWGIDIASGGSRVVVRVFVDTPWQGKIIPFSLPETRAAKSRKKNTHPMQKDASVIENTEVIEDTDNTETSDALEDAKNSIAKLGVSIDQCAEISHMIGVALDVDDAFANAWVLEVSSPGLDRIFFQLEQMRSYIGHPINVVLEDSHPLYEHRRKFRGILLKVDTDFFEIELDSPVTTPCTIVWDNVKKANLIHVFPDITLSKAALHS